MKFFCGNILTPCTEGDDIPIVCHQVNCMGVMGAGLAKQIRFKHPQAYKMCLDRCGHDPIPLGEAQFVSAISSDGYIIANLFGQYSYGTDRCHTDYDALRSAFQMVKNAFPRSPIRIPYKIGCGLGGGDWATVLTILQEVFGRQLPNIEIYFLSKIAVGKRYKLTLRDTDDGELCEHNGEVCTVLHNSTSMVDAENGGLYTVRFCDGCEAFVFGNELTPA